MPEPTASRLRDDAVAARLTRLDDLLGQVEATPGPAGEVALAAVSELTRVYGEALARVSGYAAETPGVLDAFVRDELVGHLLVLHGIHPEPVRRRVARAVDELRPAVTERGGTVELTHVDRDVATVTLSMGGCGSTVDGFRKAVREAGLAVARELWEGAIVAPVGSREAFIPIEAVSRPRGVAP